MDQPPEPEPPKADGEPTGAEDALRRLEARLDRASAAAERLLAEAAARIGGGAPGGEAVEPPPAGWQFPGQDGFSSPSAARDLELLMGFVQSLRDLIPPDLQRRLSAALRELLLAVRALIDWYLERMERQRAEPTEVQDIPIQ
jgi:hypothetical protein